jgi:DNA-binding YbaB/EbfC family protein
MSQFDLNSLFEQAQQMQKKISDAQAELAKKTVTGQAGGGMVTVTVNGGMEVVSVKLDPQCVDPRDIRMLEDLIVAATNQAVREARTMMERELGAVSGLGGMLGGLMP